jgi:hypothetical protein
MNPAAISRLVGSICACEKATRAAPVASDPRVWWSTNRSPRRRPAHVDEVIETAGVATHMAEVGDLTGVAGANEMPEHRA